jgi:TRAP-type C4-dicarboxylate transport system substrate-binding protein
MIDMVGAKKVDRLTDSETDWDKVNVTQTTYPRYHADAHRSQKYVADTKHSMYVTSILLNDSFWNSLSEQDQAHFTQAGFLAARKERAQSVADAEEIKTSESKQEKLGIEEVITWPEEEISKLKTLWSPLYEKYKNFFGNNILDKIKKI